MDNYFSARDILEKAIGTDAYFQIKSILTSTKAADVVEVVRCRECAHYKICDRWKTGGGCFAKFTTTHI